MVKDPSYYKMTLEERRERNKKIYERHKLNPKFIERRKNCSKEWRKNNGDRTKELKRLWKEKNREKLRLQQKLWCCENKEKVLAQKLSKIITIPKNQICVICKKEKAINKHHEDYNKPLEVIFCCNSCHSKLNTNRRLKCLDR